MFNIKYTSWLRPAFMAFLFLCSITLLGQNKDFKKVASNDCGNSAAQPYLILGEDYTMPVKGSQKARTCNFGGKVIYAFNNMDINADYQLETVYLADQDREQSIIVDGNVIQKVSLERGKEQRYIIDLPKKAFAYGQLVLIFDVNKGPNAVISEINLYSSNPKKLVAFKGEDKVALAKTKAYKVDTDVDVEKVLPEYAPIPSFAQGTYKTSMSLNGSWLFNPSPEKDFYLKKTSSEWKNIMVPGEWKMQGFSVDSMAFAGYRKTFGLPQDWVGKEIKVRFDGVSSEYYVFVNGEKVGYHLGGMTASEFDITEKIHEGLNEICLSVRSESLADMLGSLTQYAAHQIGGITRKVTLFALPKAHLSDLRIVTDLVDGYKNANLRIKTTIDNSSLLSQEHLKLRVSFDGLGNVIEKELPMIASGKSWTGSLESKVIAPLLWDNEHPNLYRMSIELMNGDSVLERVDKKVGFRQIEVRGNEVFLNGKLLKLKGVCHHEMYPTQGRVVDADIVRRDVELYRQANCNFIRTSHYNPCEEFLDICDEMGMFVEVEAPVCWVGHHANKNWQKLNYRDPKYYDYVLQANMESMHFNRNHPCVVFWSMANESYWNKNFAQVEQYVIKADPSRPYTFHDQAYGGFNNQGSTAPIANIHYPGPGGYKVANKSSRPMVYGEFCHLNTYNRRELETDPGVRSDWALALNPTWNNMYNTKGCLGGSIWSGIDDVFQLPDGSACGYGQWGPIDGWRRPKPELWDMKKIFTPVKVDVEPLEPSHLLKVKVQNRYLFTNLNEVKIFYRYGKESGSLLVNAAPGEYATIEVPIKDISSSNGLYLAFQDPRGFVAEECLIAVGEQEQNLVSLPSKIKTRLRKTRSEYVISGKDFKCRINRNNGRIISMIKNNKEFLVGGPYLMALPLIGGGCLPNHNAAIPVYNELCGSWEATSVTANSSKEGVEVEVKGAYDGFKGSYTLKINADGELAADYSFEALSNVNPRQWGLVFEAPKSFNENFWRRDGIWTVYPEDHISRPVGSAKLFYSGLPQKVDPRSLPSWSWSRDFNKLGSNDFRSTRRNIWYAGLKDAEGAKMTVVSNGSQHWRSWLENNKIRFLVADFNSPGCEMFLGGYYAPYRKPIKAGDTIKGTIRLFVK